MMTDKYIINVTKDRIKGEMLTFPLNVNGTRMEISTGINVEPYTVPDLEQIKGDAYSEGLKDGKAVTLANEQNNAFNDGYKKCLNDMELVRKEERDRGYEDGYQEGIFEAWEAARKILFNPDDGGMSAIDVNEVFGESSWTVMKDFSASEVAAKIKEYEDSKQKIKVGDEVEAVSGKAVIIHISDNKDKARYIYSDSTLGFDDICNLSKTGRHFPEIATVLEKMRNESNAQIDT